MLNFTRMPKYYRLPPFEIVPFNEYYLIDAKESKKQGFIEPVADVVSIGGMTVLGWGYYSGKRGVEVFNNINHLADVYCKDGKYEIFLYQF